MDSCSTRRQRLEHLIELARTYRGWTRKDLARALHRDPTKLVPASGIPKIDLVVALSGVLDWSVEAVVSYLWNGNARVDTPMAPSADFAAIDAAALQAHREGRYADLIALARQAHRHADTSEQRAVACNREAGGWDGLGRYADQLAAIQRGLRERDLPAPRRRMLQVNLANAYYTLWHLVEARTASRDLIEHFGTNPADNRSDRVVAAFAHYVHGHTHRRLLSTDASLVQEHGSIGLSDLITARDAYRALADEFDDASYLGVAETCEGGILELEVALGTREPEDVLAIFESRLDGLVDPADFPIGDRLEAHAWWCIFGCNIALRHVSDEKRLQSAMAVFTNKADELAEHLDNWAMRERVFTLEYARRQRFEAWTGVTTEWTLDRDDLRTITGTMGRFPDFERTGWEILETARLVV